jgi:hypothetical protein
MVARLEAGVPLNIVWFQALADERQLFWSQRLLVSSRDTSLVARKCMNDSAWVLALAGLEGDTLIARGMVVVERFRILS